MRRGGLGRQGEGAWCHGLVGEQGYEGGAGVLSFVLSSARNGLGWGWWLVWGGSERVQNMACHDDQHLRRDQSGISTVQVLYGEQYARLPGGGGPLLRGCRGAEPRRCGVKEPSAMVPSRQQITIITRQFGDRRYNISGGCLRLSPLAPLPCRPPPGRRGRRRR